ncbi:MAG: sugar transferase, partial [Pseudomonadales bacterium]|nr:sugar transferase [Pseudomonadales bacterium]
MADTHVRPGGRFWWYVVGGVTVLVLFGTFGVALFFAFLALAPRRPLPVLDSSLAPRERPEAASARALRGDVGRDGLAPLLIFLLSDVIALVISQYLGIVCAAAFSEPDALLPELDALLRMLPGTLSAALVAMVLARRYRAPMRESTAFVVGCRGAAAGLAIGLTLSRIFGYELRFPSLILPWAVAPLVLLVMHRIARILVDRLELPVSQWIVLHHSDDPRTLEDLDIEGVPGGRRQLGMLAFSPSGSERTDAGYLAAALSHCPRFATAVVVLPLEGDVITATRMAAIAESLGLRAFVQVDGASGLRFDAARHVRVEHVPVVRTGRPYLYRELAKRCLDIAGAVIAIMLLAPVFILLAALVMRDGGPPIFRHQRVGRHGRGFGCMKFRSMRPDADLVLARLLDSDPHARAEWERDFKLRNDPRVTPLGRYLRRTSLDELPQFWNVLVGEMSLVGPRPVV